MMAQTQQPSASDVGRLINLIPVGLREAAIDSPTSRATFIHFCEQVDILEKWLDEYMRSTNRLVSESVTMEAVLNHFISHASLPTTISESILDHDYTVLAMRKYSDGAKDYWMSMVSMVKRLNALVIEPIRSFMYNDVRAFKDVKRTLEQTQKTFDHLQTKFAALGKTKEPSSLREDAFQLHEARKMYLKASMDFFTLVPQFRFSLDKLLVRIFSDQWREMRTARDNTAATFQRSAQEMERVRGWVREMDGSEKAFRVELTTARKQLEDAAESSHRPSRELEDYAMSSVPHTVGLTAGGMPRSPKKPAWSSGEKQGWLYLRTYTGKPTRTLWVRKWAFIRNGIFGWLVQGTRAGGVEESERIGVLLCNVRPAPTEERRFCFEIKTNRNAIFLQAETQVELAAWLSTFEAAKSRAVDNPGSSDTLASSKHSHSDPAFAISPPPLPEFGTNILSSLEPGASEDNNTGERSLTLPSSSGDPSILEISKRSTGFDKEEGTREHASRIISKLDLGRKSSANPQLSGSLPPAVGGGIASLIAATHGSMPVGPSIPLANAEPEQNKPRTTFRMALRDMPPSSLAPSTLANPPAPTNLSKSAVVITGERGISAVSEKGGIPNGLLANTWGSSNMTFVNRLGRGDPNVIRDGKASGYPSPLVLPTQIPTKGLILSQLTHVADSSMSTLDLSSAGNLTRTRTPSPEKRHRHTISLDGEAARQKLSAAGLPVFPNYYPLQLKTQDAQFRLLFPSVRREERLVLVFRATWNPNDQQDFPGRAYVTTREIYFYSNHLGLVLTSEISLASIDEVTAAPGRDCDFLFLHMKETGHDASPTRITIKTFLEPLRLLQRRLNFLVGNSIAEDPHGLEEVVKILLKMESETPQRSPSMESWEDVAPDTPVDGSAQRHRARASTTTADLRAPIRVDATLTGFGPLATAALGEKNKFRLPAQPVLYTPPGNLRLAAEKLFEVSPKALFHVLFGDRSAVWQLLLHERRAQNLRQGPWVNMGEGRLRRDFGFSIPTSDVLGRETLADAKDYQVVDVNNDHLCYVVTDKRTAWHLPYQRSYRLISKVVITHVAKSRCKLAIFIKVEWLERPWLVKNMIEQRALSDLELDALDLADLVADQVRRLGVHSQTKKAIQIFGQLGQSTETTQLRIDVSTMSIETRRMPVHRTVVSLMLKVGRSVAESAVGITLEGLLSFFGWIWKTFTANSVIVTLLVLSMLYNSWFSVRDTSEWWHDRNAGKFMNRIGVSSNQVMSKAVYVSDMDDILNRQGMLPNQDSSACYSVFHDSHCLDDLDAAPASVPSGSAQQIQRTRQKLGIYRHDLLVAMRVVNSIEREMLQSEWERWVMTENRRCRQVGGFLGNGTYGELEAFGGDQDIQKWYDEYCLSCQEEHGKLTTT